MPAMGNHVQTVLNMFLKHGVLTKPEICILTELPVATVHNAASRLLAEQIIIPNSISKSNGGRKAVAYRLNQNKGCFAVFHIHEKRLDAGIFDMIGNCLDMQTITISIKDYSPDAYLGRCAHVFHDASENSGAGQLLWAVVLVSAPVENGKLLCIPDVPGWKNAEIKEVFESILHVPVTLEKTCCAAACYLKNSEEAKGNHTTVITVGDTISAAHMSNGTLIRGIRGLAGEIGHMQIRRDGVTCACGGVGCLELYCSDKGLLRQCASHIGNKPQDADGVIDLVRRGNQVAIKALTQAVRYLAEVTSAMYLNHGSDEIFVYCRWLRPHARAYQKMVDSLLSRNIFAPAASLPVQIIENSDFLLKAAADTAQKAYFEEFSFRQ